MLDFGTVFIAPKPIAHGIPTPHDGFRYRSTHPTALSLSMSDFEDALQCAAALSCEAELIVTRNVDDYTNAPIAVATPETYLKQIRRIEGTGWDNSSK